MKSSRESLHNGFWRATLNPFRPHSALEFYSTPVLTEPFWQNNEPKMNQEASQHVQEEILVTDVWSRDGWELTWPLWHMLPRDERRKIARNHGFNHIGDFEEFMSLQQAERDTTVAYPNNLVYPVREEVRNARDKRPNSTLCIPISHIL